MLLGRAFSRVIPRSSSWRLARLENMPLGRDVSLLFWRLSCWRLVRPWKLSLASISWL